MERVRKFINEGNFEEFKKAYALCERPELRDVILGAASCKNYDVIDYMYEKFKKDKDNDTELLYYMELIVRYFSTDDIGKWTNKRFIGNIVEILKYAVDNKNIEKIIGILSIYGIEKEYLSKKDIKELDGNIF